MKDPNERRAMLAIVLCLIIYYVWSVFFLPPPELADTAAGTPVAEAPTAPRPSDPVPSPAPAEVAVACDPSPRSIASDMAALEADGCGGGLRQITLPNTQAAIQVTPWWTWIMNLVTGTSRGPWVPYGPEQGQQKLLGEDVRFALAGRGHRASTMGTWTTTVEGDALVLRTASDGFSVEQRFAPTESVDVWSYTARFEASRPLEGPLWVGIAGTFDDPTGAYDMNPHVAGVVDGALQQLLSPTGLSARDPMIGKVSWFGVEDRYHLAAIAPVDGAGWTTLEWAPLPGGQTGAFLVGPDRIAPGAPVTLEARLFTGPKDVERLEQLGSDLGDAANLGWFGFFAKILLFILHIYHAGVGNWGVSILLLTFTIRLAFYPLSATAFRSGKMMQAIQPKLKELQERFKDDKEALNRETIALFTKHKVNPLGGCLPMLVQMPVFFALYTGLQFTPDLFHADFLYLRDLSAPDPYGVLPTIMAIGMILQQQLTPMTGMDPAQQQMMRIMPLVFALFMFGLPSGLALYYALNTLLSIAQQWYNTRSIKPIELHD